MTAIALLALAFSHFLLANGQATCDTPIPCNPSSGVGCGYELISGTPPFQLSCGCACIAFNESGTCQPDPVNVGKNASTMLTCATLHDCPVYPGYSVICFSPGPYFNLPVRGCCQYTATPFGMAPQPPGANAASPLPSSIPLSHQQQASVALEIVPLIALIAFSATFY